MLQGTVPIWIRDFLDNGCYLNEMELNDIYKKSDLRNLSNVHELPNQSGSKSSAAYNKMHKNSRKKLVSVCCVCLYIID